MLFRLAPTPSGYLHLGNAVNFGLTWLAAQSRGARLLLRIDDLDADRKRPAYLADIFQTIDWLGVDYDLGPTGPDDFEAYWSQRHRLDAYQATLDQLRAGGYVYACGLSRRALQVAGPTYPAEGRRQGLSLDAADVAWRFRTEDGPAGGNDFVVRRRDGLPAYQIASLTDDHTFGVTHLVRGEDLLESTDRQRQLALALGWTDFLTSQVWHHPVLLGSDGAKISKSAGNGVVNETSIQTFRGQPAGLSRVLTLIARLLNAPAGGIRHLRDLLPWAPTDALFVASQTVKLS